MKKLNKKRIILVGIILVIIIVLGILICKKIITNNEEQKKEETKIEEEIKDYGYVLLENKTTLYKNYFKELIETLNSEEIDETQYASSVVKLFISDFYDLNTKITKNDIGGLQFIYDKVQENFILNAKETLYKYVENNITGDRIQKLPSVKSVTIENIEKTTFTYNAESITDKNAYSVKVNWEYTEDLGYQTSATIILIHVDNKLVIVELK